MTCSSWASTTSKALYIPVSLILTPQICRWDMKERDSGRLNPAPRATQAAKAKAGFYSDSPWMQSMLFHWNTCSSIPHTSLTCTPHVFNKNDLNFTITVFSVALSVDRFQRASRNCKDTLTNIMVHLKGQARKTLEALRKDGMKTVWSLQDGTFQLLHRISNYMFPWYSWKH